MFVFGFGFGFWALLVSDDVTLIINGLTIKAQQELRGKNSTRHTLFLSSAWETMRGFSDTNDDKKCKNRHSDMEYRQSSLACTKSNMDLC